MDRETTFLLALGLLFLAGVVVCAAGWILFVRDRRSGRGEPAADVAAGDGSSDEASAGG